MTAEEIARGNLFLQLSKELPNEKFEETYQVPEWCLKSMKEFALLIAREAVEEEINEQILQNGLRPEIIRNAVHEVLTGLPLKILSRIEKLTEES